MRAVPLCQMDATRSALFMMSVGLAAAEDQINLLEDAIRFARVKSSKNLTETKI